MIHSTPLQEEVIEKSSFPPIRSAFKGYETTFVILHPFLKVKPHYHISFETGNWPTKKEIIACTQNTTWAEVIQLAGLRDISELDRLLAYLHCERRTADRDGWIKLMTLLDKNGIIPAEVDYLPTSLTNPIMGAFKSLGYTTVEEFDFTGKFIQLHEISSVRLSEEQSFASTARVFTPDKKVVLATDFDQRFTYLSASPEMVRTIIEAANLEGFYCNETTKPDWSENLQTDNLIDWSSPERRRDYSE